MSNDKTPTTAFNGLTPAEAERLAMLAEECGEVVQMVGKILRHGYESCHPAGGETNREALARECGDVRALVRLMIRETDIGDAAVAQSAATKIGRAARYMHHQEV